MKTNYLAKARCDAEDTALNFLDEIVEQLIDCRKASDDLNNDYPGGDSYHHESHVDKSYSLTEAAELLDDLSEWKETDYGLWQGLEPRRAIECQAAYTYGNAVYHFWRRLIEEINDDDEIQEHLDKRDEDLELEEPLVGEEAWEVAITKRVKEVIEEF